MGVGFTFKTIESRWFSSSRRWFWWYKIIFFISCRIETTCGQVVGVNSGFCFNIHVAFRKMTTSWPTFSVTCGWWWWCWCWVCLCVWSVQAWLVPLLGPCQPAAISQKSVITPKYALVRPRSNDVSKILYNVWYKVVISYRCDFPKGSKSSFNNFILYSA